MENEAKNLGSGTDILPAVFTLPYGIRSIE